jgi:hypothetical protein
MAAKVTTATTATTAASSDGREEDGAGSPALDTDTLDELELVNELEARIEDDAAMEELAELVDGLVEEVVELVEDEAEEEPIELVELVALVVEDDDATDDVETDDVDRVEEVEVRAVEADDDAELVAGVDVVDVDVAGDVK